MSGWNPFRSPPDVGPPPRKPKVQSAVYEYAWHESAPPLHRCPRCDYVLTEAVLCSPASRVRVSWFRQCPVGDAHMHHKCTQFGCGFKWLGPAPATRKIELRTAKVLP